MELLIQLTILIVSLIILQKAAHVSTDNAFKIAKATGLGGLVIGFIILSVATNLPELSVAFYSILFKQEDITLGNIFGANIGNVTWNIGLIAVFLPMVIYKKTLKELSKMLFIASAIPLLLLLYTSRILGLALILVFVLFSYYSAKKRIKLEKQMKKGKINLSTIFYLALGLIFVIISSRFLVSSAANIATILGISKAIIGASIISIGTTIPEFAVGLSAVKKGYVSLALGSVLGSFVTTVTLVLGFVLLISPVTINLMSYSTLIGFMIFSAVLLWFFVRKGRLNRIDGIILVLFYALFLLTTYGIEIIF